MADYFVQHYARPVRLFREMFSKERVVRALKPVTAVVEVPMEVPPLARHKDDDPYGDMLQSAAAPKKQQESSKVPSAATLAATTSSNSNQAPKVAHGSWDAVKSLLDEEVLKIEMQLRARIDHVSGKLGAMV
jgi:hypothetical protein